MGSLVFAAKDGLALMLPAVLAEEPVPDGLRIGRSEPATALRVGSVHTEMLERVLEIVGEREPEILPRQSNRLTGAGREPGQTLLDCGHPDRLAAAHPLLILGFVDSVEDPVQVDPQRQAAQFFVA